MGESVDPAPEAQPLYAPEHEVRHAVVMYGGVSMAIYMYGIAEELHHLVCSTAEDADNPGHLRPPSRTESVYREVARARSGGEVKTRFVVDIISGTSAGGINGICLAKALARDAPISGLKDLWLVEGDIGALVNDEESQYEIAPDGRGERIPGVSYAEPPLSLLSGARMQAKLVTALAGITSGNDEESQSRLVDELDLWVTSTDLDGLPVKLRLSDVTVTEPRHANRYHFRYAAASEGRDDFKAGTNAFLAYAARATSAFPFAFDPAVLDKLEPFVDAADGWSAMKSGWQRFYRPFNGKSPEFAARAFSDGGILDNKPFSYATESLLARPARMPVERKLIYIEPDPVELSAVDRPQNVWSAIKTARAAVLDIPRIENIREDIQAVLVRNREIERVRDVLSQIGVTDAERDRIQALCSTPEPRTWAGETLASELEAGAAGPTYGVYYRLKVRSVVDWLADTVLSAAAFDPRSDQALAVHQLVRAWKREQYAESPGPDDERLSDNAFLTAYDLPYRMRRLNFLQQKLKDLAGPDADRTYRAAGVDPVPTADGEALLATRLAIDAAKAELVDAGRAIAEDLVQPIQALGLTADHLKTILDSEDDDAMLKAASVIVASRRSEFDAVATVIAERVASASENAFARLNGPLSADDGPESEALRAFYKTYEAYDLAWFPLVFGTDLGEANPVSIVRISPADAKGPLGREREPLKGASLYHFGAFLDERWRSYDIVWGRLDGAERLIGALLGPDHPRRLSLVAQAHEEIIAEYAKPFGVSRKRSMAWFRDEHKAPATSDEERTLKAFARGRNVVGKLLVDAVGKSASTGTSLIAAPVIQAVVNEAPRRQVVWALARTTIGGVVLAVLGALFAAGVVALFAVGTGAAVFVKTGAAVGGGLIGFAIAIPLAVLAAVYFGLGALRKEVEKATRAALFPPPPR
ncbi:MAG TPA: patatin-like protein [Solirubrobacteraceae bacterium]|nr:patatin-like protein [Solirubrobacteraceae bacterium]